MTYPEFFLLIAAVLVFAIVAKDSALSEQTSEPRKTYALDFFSHTSEHPGVPVLQYSQSRAHHGGWIVGDDTNIDEIVIWKDGTIAWSIAGNDRHYRNPTHWYQTTIPVEKVEAALREIAESFAKYPIKDRPRLPHIFFRLGANYSPSIRVRDARHFESLRMDHQLWQIYQMNREGFQSGDNALILGIIKAGLPFNYEVVLMGYYGARLRQAGLFERRDPVASDEEILKCVALFTADAEHLLLMEKKILELLPSHEGLQARRINRRSRHILVEREINDGKSEFFYSQISERERDEIRAKMRAEREQE
jgi:hypothetical protein